ncbi:threonylcarbamoyl-AMP synthase [Robertkochia marina]|uniref:Threonylcarbamoyl-AMP synthase n=1 Tax=Robertkochia marina TaxID=1227945 RepID=A0A4S3M5W3_9FLAO|nr:L-threonylcarbamoyladenylate synthase [Robertkochia marina]THD69607.1 threonylcarbamoyl-AMP synthase [Robertkochia marina]TRZ40835.1 threonylcarbamoyl-AMP synthase [Robertkochia marina]
MAKDSALEQAVRLLQNDELVAIPTETVYGLAANAFSDTAVEKIYQTKNRPANNPLIVHIANRVQLTDLAVNIPEQALKLAEHFWPGPLTLVLEKAPHISKKITAGKNTVAVRMPNHELTLSLLRKLDFPLVAPSANRSNHISPTRPEHVKESLGNKAPFILDGGSCTKGIESTIVGFDNGQPVIYRLGTVSKEDIENVLGRSVRIMTKESKEVVTPGMFKKHYSPKTPFIATHDLHSEIEKHPGKKLGIISFTTSVLPTDEHIWKVLSPGRDPMEAASRLYALMHELDGANLDLIIAEYLPEQGVGASVNDRMRRASSK